MNRQDEAGGIVVLDLEAPDKKRLPGFLPGQHLSIAAEIDGKMISRSYSLCGAPDDLGPATYRIAIKHIAAVPGEVEEGVFSGFSARNLKKGAIVQAAAPSGTFIIPLEADFPVVLIATGIGITPFLAYLEAMTHVHRPPEIHLYYASRNGAHHAFQKRLAELASLLPSLHLHTLYSQPSEADRAAALFSIEGRIGAHSFKADLIARRPRFYMCGPDAMMTSVTQGLVARGVLPFDIFSERFISPVTPDPAASDAKFAVTFARSGRQAIWSAEGGDLLTFAEAQGLAPSSGCRVGQCESCAVKVLSGTISHMVPVAELDEGMCLACQAIPSSDIVLDL